VSLALGLQQENTSQAAMHRASVKLQKVTHDTKSLTIAWHWARLVSLALGLQQENTSQAVMHRASVKLQKMMHDTKSLAIAWHWARVALVLESISENTTMMEGIRRERAKSVGQRETVESWHRDRLRLHLVTLVKLLIARTEARDRRKSFGEAAIWVAANQMEQVTDAARNQAGVTIASLKWVILSVRMDGSNQVQAARKEQLGLFMVVEEEIGVIKQAANERVDECKTMVIAWAWAGLAALLIHRVDVAWHLEDLRTAIEAVVERSVAGALWPTGLKQRRNASSSNELVTSSSGASAHFSNWPGAKHLLPSPSMTPWPTAHQAEETSYEQSCQGLAVWRWARFATVSVAAHTKFRVQLMRLVMRQWTLVRMRWARLVVIAVRNWEVWLHLCGVRTVAGALLARCLAAEQRETLHAAHAHAAYQAMCEEAQRRLGNCSQIGSQRRAKHAALEEQMCAHLQQAGALFATNEASVSASRQNALQGHEPGREPSSLW